ncbi:uncharacterized protein [Anas acuta]|uniref:uncharacterized protein n=1 Tax=Anas acuta TaxID=28680 RepID=UPI0035C8F8FE
MAVAKTLQLILLVNNRTVYEPEIRDQIHVKPDVRLAGRKSCAVCSGHYATILWDPSNGSFGPDNSGLWHRWGLGEGGSGLLDLPLGVKIPLLPGTKPVFYRTKLGEKLHQPSAQFHLEDPYCRLLRTEYNCLHDPHLQAYYSRKDSLQSLKSKGFITSSGKVVCSLKEFNEYRQYLTTLKLEAEKIRRQEEEKLQQQFAKLKKLDARLMAGSDRSRQSSSTNVYLVTKEKASLLQPQKPAGPPTHKSRRNFLHSGQHRRLKVTPSSVELGREDAKLPGSVHPVRESERKSPIPADGVFKAAAEEQAATENQRIEEMARAVVRQVFERVQALDQSVCVLKRSLHGIQERPCASAESEEPSEASPLDKEQQIALLAKKVVANVMKALEKSWESGTPSASEPRPEGSQKEQLLARRASQVGKPNEKKPREALEGAFSQASLDKVTNEAVGSVCDTLESFVASRAGHEGRAGTTKSIRIEEPRSMAERQVARDRTSARQ